MKPNEQQGKSVDNYVKGKTAQLALVLRQVTSSKHREERKQEQTHQTPARVLLQRWQKTERQQVPEEEEQ